jgi:excisionase family DNA binding protein
MQVMSVAEAAESLGVSEAQVGRLIARGDIVASRWGRSWMINRASVYRYADLRPSRGRPYPPAKAWEVLRSASVSSIDDVKQLAVMCRRRAERHDIRILPGLFDRVRQDPRVMLSGVDAAKFYGGAVSVMPPLDFYVKREHIESFQKDFVVNSGLSASNCVVRILDEEFNDIPLGHHVPLLVALVDLIAEGDYRSAAETIKCLEVPNVERSTTDTASAD